jgi:hypothetical protein
VQDEVRDIVRRAVIDVRGDESAAVRLLCSRISADPALIERHAFNVARAGPLFIAALRLRLAAASGQSIHGDARSLLEDTRVSSDPSISAQVVLEMVESVLDGLDAEVRSEAARLRCDRQAPHG